MSRTARRPAEDAQTATGSMRSPASVGRAARRSPIARPASAARWLPPQRPRCASETPPAGVAASLLLVEVEVEPDAVAQLYAVDLKSRLVSVRSGEGVALDRAHAKAEPLVDAQVVRVGGCGGDGESGASVVAREVDCRSHQGAADTAALVVRSDGGVLDFGFCRSPGLGELKVADRLVLVHRHE